jgi:hypothetical protein
MAETSTGNRYHMTVRREERCQLVEDPGRVVESREQHEIAAMPTPIDEVKCDPVREAP